MMALTANGWAPLAYGFSAWCQAIANGGRLLMTELGLAGFIEKFEAYFGKKVTFAMLLLVGLAVASTCGLPRCGSAKLAL